MMATMTCSMLLPLCLAWFGEKIYSAILDQVVDTDPTRIPKHLKEIRLVCVFFKESLDHNAVARLKDNSDDLYSREIERITTVRPNWHRKKNGFGAPLILLLKGATLLLSVRVILGFMH